MFIANSSCRFVVSFSFDKSKELRLLYKVGGDFSLSFVIPLSLAKEIEEVEC